LSQACSTIGAVYCRRSGVHGTCLAACITIRTFFICHHLDQGKAVDEIKQSSGWAEKSAPESRNEQTAQEENGEESYGFVEPKVVCMFKREKDRIEKLPVSDWYRPARIIEDKEIIERKGQHEIFQISCNFCSGPMETDFKDGDVSQELGDHTAWTGPSTKGSAENKRRNSYPDPAPQPD
jgi:hypothetical protein